MAVTLVVVAISRAGEDTAHRIAAARGWAVHGRAGRVDRADAHFDNALTHVRDLFAAGVPVVGVCAAGILIRAVAPLLADKTAEPPVVAVAEDGSVVVPLLGGHRGANRIAADLSDLLGGVSAVTTAGDVALGVALDAPPSGYRLANPGDAKSVMAGLLSGGGARLTGEALFDLPAGEGAEIAVTEAPLAGGPDRLVYHPQRFALGAGCARDADPQVLRAQVFEMLAEAGVAPGAVASLNTLGLKADEPAMHALAAELGVPLRVFTDRKSVV